MRAEIVAVGTEILLGQIANTNARWMSERLAAVGVDVTHHQVIGDNIERIVGGLRLAASRADVVLVTGGLGPTQDDVTREAIALFLGLPLVRDPGYVAWLRERFGGFGRGEMPENNLRQADAPRGFRMLWPERGSAPGLAGELPGGGRIYAVAGVPAEMVEMMERTILPELAERSGAALVSRVVRCTAIGESRVAELLDDLFAATENPSVAFLADAGEVKIRLTAKASDADLAEAMLAPLMDQVVARLGDLVFTTADERLEEAVLRLLRGGGRSLALAESLTGGSVAARITSVPGASDAFRGSAVVYTADAKRDVLGVTPATIAGPGVVSEACAREMAAGARRIFAADLAVALTGAAGPEPHGGAPAGTVWLALAGEGVDHARTFVATGDRERVRRWAEQGALDLLRRHLEGRPLPTSDRVI
ncbi:MAG: competence/damage-inducible protein A [Actinomycetota bacterium]